MHKTVLQNLNFKMLLNYNGKGTFLHQMVLLHKIYLFMLNTCMEWIRKTKQKQLIRNITKKSTESVTVVFWNVKSTEKEY